jgi:hypothetical protein
MEQKAAPGGGHRTWRLGWSRGLGGEEAGFCHLNASSAVSPGPASDLVYAGRPPGGLVLVLAT